MKTKKSLLLILFFSLIITSCSDSTSDHDVDEIEMLLEEVRSATSAFHNIDDARAAGWSAFLSPCVEHPQEGGMGYHVARPEFIDGRISHTQPQVLLYEPTEGGGYEFVGVEYIIPFAILPADSDPPVLFDHEYHQNQELQIWALHVWTEKENPKGTFNDWNPNVSCQFEVNVLLNEVREITAPFHDIDSAIDAGWAVDLSGCVEHPDEGGMGHHFGRPEFIDGRINHLEPQVLLYEPLEDGGFEFVGVEYIIPFDILPADSDPPVLFNEMYHQNPMLEIWALHVWTEKENPQGIFYDWNPNVSCQFAAE